jgi:hypothetical protein
VELTASGLWRSAETEVAPSPVQKHCQSTDAQSSRYKDVKRASLLKIDGFGAIDKAS